MTNRVKRNDDNNSSNSCISSNSSIACTFSWCFIIHALLYKDIFVLKLTLVNNFLCCSNINTVYTVDLFPLLWFHWGRKKILCVLKWYCKSDKKIQQNNSVILASQKHLHRAFWYWRKCSLDHVYSLPLLPVRFELQNLGMILESNVHAIWVINERAIVIIVHVYIFRFLFFQMNTKASTFVIWEYFLYNIDFFLFGWKSQWG
jgi:hypothetical protein